MKSKGIKLVVTAFIAPLQDRYIQPRGQPKQYGSVPEDVLTMNVAVSEENERLGGNERLENPCCPHGCPSLQVAQSRYAVSIQG